MPGGRPWKDDHARLVAMAAAGAMIADVAKKLNRTPAAVASYANRKNIAFRTYEKCVAAGRKAATTRDPAKFAAALSASWTPERREQLSRRNREQHARGGFPRYERTAEHRAKVGARISAYWAARREAKRFRFDLVVEAVRWAAMTPFERQLARVSAGARIAERPVLRAAEPAYTMGGVASYGG